MKKIFLALSFLPFVLNSCHTQKSGIKPTSTSSPTSTLVAHFPKCKEAIGLFEFDGIDFRLIEEKSHAPGDSFRFEVAASAPRFYYVGTRNARKRPVILGAAPEVFVFGNCNNARQAKFKDSPINTAYDQLLQTFRQWNGAMRQAARALQQAAGNPQKTQAAIAQMAAIDQEKRSLIDSLQKTQAYIAKIAVLNAYLSYQNNNKGRYKNEVEYFGRAYFELADLSDPAYNHIPYIHEAFKNWSKVLVQQRIPQALLEDILEETFAKIPAGSRTMKYALGATVQSMQAANHPLFAQYGNRYIALFDNSNHPKLLALKKKIDMSAQFAIGAVAPDFSQRTPEGERFSLSDLRGKVVLVDFWASWCGPCRKENPHVRHLYEKYKDHGFEVLGVSLDRKKNAWIKAIEKDKLPWHHISDLKGWQNEAAQLYSVSSIPHTILLDREGRILARNLRGEQLSAALTKIFGQ